MVGRESGRLMCQGSQVLTPLPAKLFFFNIHFEDLFCKFAKEEMYIFRQKKRMKILFKKSIEGFPVEFGGDIPVKFAGISL